MNIRQAMSDDLASIYALESLAGFNSWSEKQLSHYLTVAKVWLLEDENTVIGFCIFQQVFDEIELFNIVLHPSQQGKGLAQKLLQYAFTYFDSRQVISCLLEVGKANVAAIALYERLGFEEVSVRKNYYHLASGVQDALLMKKNIH